MVLNTWHHWVGMMRYLEVSMRGWQHFLRVIGILFFFLFMLTSTAYMQSDQVIADVYTIVLNEETHEFDIELVLQGMTQVVRYEVSFVRDELVAARYPIEGFPDRIIHIPTTNLIEGTYDIIVRTFSVENQRLSEYRGQIIYMPLPEGVSASNLLVSVLPIILVLLLGLTLIVLVIRLISRDRTQKILLTLPPMSATSGRSLLDSIDDEEDDILFIDNRAEIPKVHQAIIYVDRTEAELDSKTFVVDKTPFKLGRRKTPKPSIAPDINFYNDREVSRDHAEIIFNPETQGYLISDSSANGTYIGEDPKGKPLKKLKPRELERLELDTQEKVRVQLGKSTVFYISYNEAHIRPDLSSPRPR